MANTGLNTPMQATKPSWTANTSTSPAPPGPMKANPPDQQARNAPAVNMTLCCPNRATSRRASRSSTRTRSRPLIVHPAPTDDGDYAFTYDFAPALARTPAIA